MYLKIKKWNDNKHYFFSDSKVNKLFTQYIISLI